MVRIKMNCQRCGVDRRCPCRGIDLTTCCRLLLLFAVLLPLGKVTAEETVKQSFLEQTKSQARQLEPLTKSDLGRQFLSATNSLPIGEARTIYRQANTKRFAAESELAQLGADERREMKPRKIGKDQFYTTKYGTPLAYWRPLDLVGAAGLESVEDRKVLDIGYGGIGHLRMLALTGAEAVGVDVDTYLTALYSRPSDQGAVLLNGQPQGSVRLVHGRWPTDVKTQQSIGSGYELILSKNTLKRGYIHPAKKVEARFTIQLGVDDETYCRTIHRILRPGGFVMIYNISPPPNTPDKPYIPWADGRCPFDRELLERLGFTVLAYNNEDNDVVRKMGRILGWGKSSADLETLFARYTILRKATSERPEKDR